MVKDVSTIICCPCTEIGLRMDLVLQWNNGVRRNASLGWIRIEIDGRNTSTVFSVQFRSRRFSRCLGRPAGMRWQPTRRPLFLGRQDTPRTLLTPAQAPGRRACSCRGHGAVSVRHVWTAALFVTIPKSLAHLSRIASALAISLCDGRPIFRFTLGGALGRIVAAICVNCGSIFFAATMAS